jgi:metal-dependent amidase/aminoacylase/carboxypeptidase family protein
MFERARQAMESISQPIPNRGGAPAQHADNDELRGRCEVVERQRDALIRRQRQKEYLTALLVHDLKDPVTAVGLLAQTMLNRDMLSEQDARSVKRMCAEVQVLDRMILNLLDISISAAGGSLVVKRDQIDIRSLCAGVLAELAWRGTLLVVFQPGEETAQGARAMIDDDLFKRFPKPDVVLAQHLMVGRAGHIAGSSGPITSAADSLQIRLFGRGAHGSMPQASVDPVVMAAATVLRLQTIVAREVAATEAAVVTVGVLQAGTKENVIPDEAIIKLNVRTFDAGVRERVLAAIERIVNAEAAASGAPRKPEITTLDRYPLNVNDEKASLRLAEAFRAHFTPARVHHTGPAPASEDFGCFGSEWHAPSVFWFVGGNDPESYDRAVKAGKLNELPVNHSPHFAPAIHPTLKTGVEAFVVAALTWLS